MCHVERLASDVGLPIEVLLHEEDACEVNGRAAKDGIADQHELEGSHAARGRIGWRRSRYSYT